MTNPFRDVKKLKLSNKTTREVWNEMTEEKRNITKLILDAIITKTELTAEQKVKCLGLLPSFSDDEFALLCYVVDKTAMPLFMYD